ncbi:pyrrolo-quinoline quinone [Salipiger pallidus]|uniref:Pyrrolo-quinoline quinone n=1 Tax=Salipiger pallidus TaxID=1775170 RepID=A0A8J2ZGQ7_9RHOB|nr:PQQ-like beta-propeller repeat protein [Salipiger pallidus]GGG61027.1 pyrrolo-quinoline quinone [Salipiger pallidus]
MDLRITTITAGLIGLTVLAGCEEADVILPGERYGTREVLEGASTTDPAPMNGARAISLPAISSNGAWAQSPASPAMRVGNAALAASLSPVLSVDIGAGDSRRNRLNVDPVAADGRIFAMDSEHVLTAVSTSGQVLWRKPMIPARDTAQQAQGGGLAVSGGRLYVASGFGSLTALDPATGAEIWQQQLGGTATGAPSVQGDLAYVVSGDSRAWAIETATGRIRWQIESVESIHNFAGAPSPAIGAKSVIFGFGNGGVQAAFREGGMRRWNGAVSGSREGYAIATVSDLTGGPVIADGRVYVGNHSGRVAAFSEGSGDRLWTAQMGTLAPIWPAGDSVFLVSDTYKLVRLDASTGEQVWSVDLPGYEEVRRPQRRRDSAYAHHGPILAGGRLIVASSDGYLRSFDPTNGALTGVTEVPGGATTMPIVAGGTLYVVSTDGQLLGYR